MTHDVRDEVVDYVKKWSGRTELPATRLVKWIGVGMSKFYQWRTRYGKVNEHNALVPRDHSDMPSSSRSLVTASRFRAGLTSFPPR